MLLYSCKTDFKEIDPVEEIAISSLRKSNEALKEFSRQNYSSLSGKLKNAIYAERIQKWNNKALELKKTTAAYMNQIEKLYKINKISNDTIAHLKVQYIKEINLLDSTINKELKNDVDSFLSTTHILLPALFLLEKSKNDMLLYESSLSMYYNLNAGLNIESYTVFSTIVSQNTKHLKPGETLDISAAVCSISTAADPVFIINGSTVKAGEDAFAKYSVKVSGKGKKTIPVKIFYTSDKGTRESNDTTIDYYVD